MAMTARKEALYLSYLVFFTPAIAVRAGLLLRQQSDGKSDNLYQSWFLGHNRKLLQDKSADQTNDVHAANTHVERGNTSMHTLAYELRAKRFRSSSKGTKKKTSMKGNKGKGSKRNSIGINSKSSSSKGSRMSSKGAAPATAPPMSAPISQPPVPPNGSLSPTPMPSSPPAVLLYENDFESPIVRFDMLDQDLSDFEQFRGCGIFASFNKVNTHYGRNMFMFSQDFSVESIFLNPPGLLYAGTTEYVNSDIDRSGNFAIGMLTDLEDDKLGLEFNSQGLRYINVRMDISSIDVNCCCPLNGIEDPIFRLSAIDSSNGPPSLSAPPLDSADMVGKEAPNGWTFSWESRSVALDVGGAINGQVTIVWDLIQCPYAVFDNLIVTASDTPLNFNGT